MEKREKEIALNSIEAGLDNDTISKITSLTTRQIEELRKSHRGKRWKRPPTFLLLGMAGKNKRDKRRSGVVHAKGIPLGSIPLSRPGVAGQAIN